LEEVEEIVFNLTHQLDVQAMNARIEEYLRLNAELIQRNLDRQEDEDQAIQRAMEEERQEYLLRKESDIERLRREQEQERMKRLILPSPAGAEMEAVKKQKGGDGEAEKRGEELERGPSLMKRLARMNENRRAAAVRDVNPFPDPLESPYLRPRLAHLRSDYYDPFLADFMTDKFVAGGFSAQVVFTKAISLLNQALFVANK
jgi:hypothetical protein